MSVMTAAVLTESTDKTEEKKETQKRAGVVEG